MKKWVGVVVAAFALVFLPRPAFADSFTLQDTSTANGAGTTYTLTLEPSCTSGCVATLTIGTINNPGWYIDWIGLKIAGGGVGDNTQFSIDLAPSTNWYANNSSTSPVSVYNAGPQDTGSLTIPNGGFSAFYVTGILSSTSPPQLNQGIPLNPGSTSFTLSYDLAPGSSFLSPPHLLVGYYKLNPTNDYLFFNQLSQDFQASEPNSLGLMGMGLLIVGGLLRRASKSRDK